MSYVGENHLLLTESFAARDEFQGYESILVEPGEAPASNAILINDCLVMPVGYPRTRQKLAAQGLEIAELDVSEAHKMDGGLTCMSIRF